MGGLSTRGQPLAALGSWRTDGQVAGREGRSTLQRDLGGRLEEGSCQKRKGRVELLLV